MGAADITDDVASAFGTRRQMAERMKCFHGSANASPRDNHDMIQVTPISAEDGGDTMQITKAQLIGVVRQRLEQHQGGWLLDGFPRNPEQAEALDQLLAELNQSIELVVLLELDDAQLIQRLLSRGRSDDNEAVIRHRLTVYRDQTAPLIARYRNLGLLEPVEANGTVETIAGRIEALLA